MMRRLPARQRPDASGDGGFSLVEVIVAMVVIAVGLLGLMAVQVRSLSTVALAKERQTATGLASRAMEQLRAVPYTVLQGGVVCSELAGDPDVAVTAPSGSCSATFSPSYDTSIAAESIVTTTAAQVAPLSPHQPADVAINAATYRVRTYVTRVDPDPTVDSGYWLTVVASWTSGNSRNVRKVIGVRSRVYSPMGCLSPTTHPFSGPCQPFLYSNAGSIPGGISLETDRAPGSVLVDGLPAKRGSVTFFDASARTQYEQTLSTQASLQTGSASLLESLASQSGGVSTLSTADTDPATGAPSAAAAASTASQRGGALSSTAGGSRLDVTAASADAGTAYATTAAAASPVCSDQNAAAVSAGRNCASAAVTPSGTSSARLVLDALSTRGLVLADSASSTSATNAFGGRFATPSASPAHCATTSGTGCVAAGVKRSFGTADAGGLPALSSGESVVDAGGTDRTAALAGSPLVTISGYADSAYSEAGTSPGAASTVRTGSLSYWSGSGFTPVTLTAATSGTYSVPLVKGLFNGGSYSVTVSGTVTVTAASSPSNGTSPCVAAACGVKASAGSVVVSLTYHLYSGALQVGGFVVKLDLGQALAQTTYKGAPSA